MPLTKVMKLLEKLCPKKTKLSLEKLQYLGAEVYWICQ